MTTARFTLAAIAALLLAGTALAAERRTTTPVPAPPEAMKVIDEVERAARTQDMNALRATMARNFTWSFGGDADADQALAEWRQDPRYLKALAHVLHSPCRTVEPDLVECPASGGLGFRAGFAPKDGQWRMTYFVEGD